jgi:tetratricopeptide (TPR) repeat protein
MKKAILSSALLSLAVLGCTSLHSRLDRTLNGENPYEKPPFYMRYVGDASALDRNIARTVDALRKDPENAALHNDLGALLLEKGFPKDATTEFRRAVDHDPKLYSAWYNLGLIRETQGDLDGAQSAFHRTLSVKPGHAAALFQLGLVEEKRGREDRAIALYAKAFRINRALLDVHVNPRILDSRLADRALLASYEIDHAQASAEFQATPSGYMQPRRRETPVTTEPSDAPDLEAPSKQADPTSIVTPAPASTDLSRQAERPSPPPAPAKPRAQAPAPRPQSPQAPPRAKPDSSTGDAGDAPVFTLRPNASATAPLP